MNNIFPGFVDSLKTKDKLRRIPLKRVSKVKEIFYGKFQLMKVHTLLDKILGLMVE